ncbi:DUF5696 domain-containing protein [Bacillus sp. JCM 19034]|uniref:DUF5696 domain-containing protein n=1 Tax=Bacillus sp. JCM 19034 TaxID=1481928 RepID=UPI000781E3B5|nr:DUF5696 domain-containing protein [Bacillus sp. JCM 19034]
MISSCKRGFYYLLIIAIILPLVLEQKIVVAVENEESAEFLEEDTEIDLPEIDESTVETELEVEEVELSERDDFTEKDIEAHLEKMQLISENDTLELYFHSTTAEVAVKVKNSSQVWFSNPVDRQTDTVASGENETILHSQLSLTYYHPTGQTSRMHSNESVRNGQFEFETIENGIKVIYTLGDTSKGIEMIPERISRERFETLILNKIEDEDTKVDLLSRFQYIEEEDYYERREVSFDSKIVLNRTIELFEEIGYTEEDVAIDNAGGNELTEEGYGKPNFVIPIQYALEGEQLIVTVIGEEIEQNESFPISEVKVLEFFGAANEFREGYIFVPDGSGSLIHLNNEKVNFQPYLDKVYGDDNATLVRQQMEVSEKIRLPVFGMKQDDQAFIAIIEQGDAVASIGADVAGRINSYNTVNSRFNLREGAQVTLTGGERASTITMFQQDGYQDHMSIRYQFLEGEKASYSGMAEFYRNYLLENAHLTPLEPTEELPFYLELVGSIVKRKTFLGVPYQSVESVTTFKEAEEIVTELYDAGVHNIKLRYSGWFNGGLKHKAPKSVKVDSQIGGTKGLEEFHSFLQGKQIELYPDVTFLHVERNSFTFNPSREAARYVNRQPAIRYPFNPASFRRDRNKLPYYVLSPARLPDYVEGFSNDFAKFNIEGLSLRDMGDELNSDFRDRNVINREQAKRIVQEQLSVLDNQFNDLLIEGGNFIALQHANHIVHAPIYSSGFNITDETVPFYQMVIHGSIDYAGMPVNLSANQAIHDQMLKALETGSNVYFQWFYQDSSIVKETEFDDLFSMNYQVWFDDAVEMYQEVNQILNEVRTEVITTHEKVAEGVYQTSYSNDISILVNYNDDTVSVNGEVIEAGSYAVIRGG